MYMSLGFKRLMLFPYFGYSGTGALFGGGGWGQSGCNPPAQFKNTDFVDTMISKVLRNLRFSLNHPLKSADD